MKINGKQPDEYKVKDWSDVPYRQWLRGDVLSSLKGNTDLISVQPDAPPELPFAFNMFTAEMRLLASRWNITTIRCLNDLISSNMTWATEILAG